MNSPPAADAALQDVVCEAAGQAMVKRAFAEAGACGGLVGGPCNGWDWSCRAQSQYAAKRFMAAHFGCTSQRRWRRVKVACQPVPSDNSYR